MDVNGDGKPDLVVANANGNNVGVLLGNGDGKFQAEWMFPTGTRPLVVVTSDVNGDGKVDLITDNVISNTLSVLLGTGTGTFQSQITLAAGQGPISIATADVNGDGRPDLIASNYTDNSVSVLLGATNGNFIGQIYTIVPSLDTVAGTAGVDQVTLVQDQDHAHIDWTLGTMTAQMSMGDPNGLTISGNGSNDVIILDYTNGSPLPATLHLNGAFTVNGLQGPTPLANNAIEIGQSIVYFVYIPGSSPASAIQGALTGGYNGGRWNGSAAGLAGAITSAAAAGGPANAFGVGYADSADGIVVGQPANTVEVRFTAMGDANLDGVVSSEDAILMTRNYLIVGKTAWDLGNFNYDQAIDYADAALLQQNYGATVTTSNVSSTTNASSSGSSTQTPRSSSPILRPTPTVSNPPPLPTDDGKTDKKVKRRHSRELNLHHR